LENKTGSPVFPVLPAFTIIKIYFQGLFYNHPFHSNAFFQFNFQYIQTGIQIGNINLCFTAANGKGFYRFSIGCDEGSEPLKGSEPFRCNRSDAILCWAPFIMTTKNRITTMNWNESLLADADK
jgi:hypothetical protein